MRKEIMAVRNMYMGYGIQLIQIEEGNCEEWHKENNELKMLHKWFKDIVDRLSEQKKQQIIDEFSEYYDK